MKINFLGGQPIFFFLIVLNNLPLKLLDAQMLFWSVFFKTHKKKLLTTKNSQNDVFDSQ